MVEAQINKKLTNRAYAVQLNNNILQRNQQNIKPLVTEAGTPEQNTGGTQLKTIKREPTIATTYGV